MYTYSNNLILYVKCIKFCQVYLNKAGKKDNFVHSIQLRLSGVMLVACNQPRLDHFFHRNHQMLQIRAFIPGELVTKTPRTLVIMQDNIANLDFLS